MTRSSEVHPLVSTPSHRGTCALRQFSGSSWGFGWKLNAIANRVDIKDMRALSVRQPWAELILRGIKTVEYRSKPTRIIGERFWIYASCSRGETGRVGEGARGGSGKTNFVSPSPTLPLAPSPFPLRSDNLNAQTPPGWMIELADMLKLFSHDLLAELPRGVIVGSAVIERVTPPEAADPHGMYRWHLAGVERVRSFRKPRGHPQPVWFEPF
jgi:hypothetical protein